MRRGGPAFDLVILDAPCSGSGTLQKHPELNWLGDSLDLRRLFQVQRDLLVQDVVAMMERHFDGAELGGVVAEIDKLFSQRFDALANSLELGRPPRGSGGAGGSGHGSGGRRPRHLH